MKKDHQAPLIAFNEVTAPYGTVSTLTLPDSSKVWLNAGSTLKYPTAFTSNVREVEMSGEAYFEVHADKKHPFIVSTGDLKVTATGTAFNVLVRIDIRDLHAFRCFLIIQLLSRQ